MQKQELEQDFVTHIRTYEALLHKVCRLYAYSVADRQDLFQEIVIQLWRAYPKFKGEAKFSTWLYRIALNTAITGLRRQKNFTTSYELANLPELQSEDHFSRLEEERFEQLYRAIALLTEVEKAIVMLYLEEHSYQDMEEILGLSQGTLRVKMNRIKEKLRHLTKNSNYGT